MAPMATFLFAYNDDNIDAVLAAVKTANVFPAIPSYRAPRANWKVEGGIIRKDAPIAFTAVDVVPETLKIPQSPEWKRVDGSVELERVKTSIRVSKVTNSPDQKGWNSVGMMAVPSGVWQLVLRGTATDADGKTWPIAIRGPLIEGLTTGEMFALKARALPPHFAPDQRAVAVYAGGQASAGLMKALQDAPNVGRRNDLFSHAANVETSQSFNRAAFGRCARFNTAKLSAICSNT